MSIGPSSVDSYAGSYVPINSLRDRRDWLIDKWSGHKSRVETVTNVSNGDWWVEWPDLSQTPEAPAISNMVEMGINHWSSVGGAILPQFRVPLNKSADRRKEKASARKRERRIRELMTSSNASELAALAWGDYAGAGSAVLGGWVNFEEKDPAKRNPFLLRYDPRHTYLLKDNLGAVTELLVARKIDELELKAMYPEWKDVFDSADENDVEEWFWYMQDRIIYAIVDVSNDGRKVNRNVVLVDMEWDLGMVPAWEVIRPTFDGERRGVFDQTIHILRTMQRLMLMTIMSTEEHAFPAIATYDAVNPEDFGPAAVIQLRSSEGRVERLGPAQHFDVKDLIARLGEYAGQQSVFPQQLSGEPGASIVSGRGINASMGALDARLALAHKQFEVGFGKVAGFLLALDEQFCYGEKTVVGDYHDTKKAEDYDPRKDVDGYWHASATYGIGAGSDPANIEVRLNMNLSSGLISRATARDQLPFLDDSEAETLLIMREAMQDAVIQGVMAMSSQGDPTLAAEALDLINKEDTELDDVIKALVEVIKGPEEPAPEAAAPPPGPGGPLEALQGAESMARGGIPGQAEQAPPAGGLPPLGAILGQDSRQIS